MSAPQAYRTLVIDDDVCVHEIFVNMLSRELIQPAHKGAAPLPQANFPLFELDVATDGMQGLACVQKALAEKRPYTMAFVDMRMKEGWDGIETIDHIWRECSDLQIIICTAHADFTWRDIIKRFGHTDRLLMLKKPFDLMELRQLAYALAEKWNLFNQAQTHLDRLQRLVEERTEKLSQTNRSLEHEIAQHKKSAEELRRQRDYIDDIIQGTPAMVVGIAPTGQTTFVNPAFCKHTGFAPGEIIGRDWWRQFYPGQQYSQIEALLSLLPHGPVRDHEMTLTDKSGTRRTINWNFFTKRGEPDQPAELIAFGNDVTAQKSAEHERRMMEVQLRHAQKLESVGQLAAGIAHEVNTPSQYIGDNIRFLQKSFEQMSGVLKQYEALLQAMKTGGDPHTLVEKIESSSAACQMQFLLTETPRALDQSLDGVKNITRIVGAMRDFAHPGSGEKIATDLNQAVESTLVVAAHAYKYVATLVKDLQPDLPMVMCLPGEFNQVMLNLVVNAAHAIAEVVGDGSSGKKGTITITTRAHGDCVEVQVRDTGAGIPEAIRDKIFEPFFTTRPFGRGSGQGLAIARNVVVARHGGSLTFESKVGEGTVFTIRLPHPAAHHQAQEAA